VGGNLEIETTDCGQTGVVIDVTDHGRGISAADLSRVFDPFFTTRKDSGTGLGLSVSYGLIRQHGGRISVESEQGAWTRFRVHLLREPALGEVSDA
jgi:two-component system NtrC family sensor kinase